MKKLVRLVVILIVLFVIALGAAWFYIDAIARRAVERGGEYATGVKTTLKRANVKVFSGQFTLRDLTFDNPEGYQADHFLNIDKGNVALKFSSLREDSLHLPHLNLTDIDVNLEKKDGKANYQVILDNLKKLSSGSTEGGKTYVIDRVNLRNINAHVLVLGQTLDVPIEQIVLKEVGTAGKPLPMSQLTAVIVKAVMEAIVRKAGTALPADMLADLTKGLGELADLDKLAEIADIKGVGDLAGGAGDAAKKAADEAAKAAEDLTKKVGDGLGNILGGDKDKPK